MKYLFVLFSSLPFLAYAQPAGPCFNDVLNETHSIILPSCFDSNDGEFLIQESDKTDPNVKQQEEQQESIGNAYIEANKQIERCLKKEDPCGLYLNQIQINADKAPWGAVGTYESTQDLWYQLDDSVKEEDVFHLLKVNIKTHRSSHWEKEELLFAQDSKLLFYSFKLTEGGEILQEFKFYFSADKLIDYQEEIGEEEVPYREWSKEDTRKIIEKASKLRDLLDATI